MSLHTAAQHLASKGRDGDSMLVHMSPGEVKGLQSLALAHGGSLSINPDTGLAEASFLKRILPMVAGAALTGLSGGLINPFTASMIVGGFEGVRTGDLGKGLMAGLGAYGGAGLGQGLASAGGIKPGLASGAEALGTTPEALSTTEGMTRALTADTGVGSSMGINSFDALNTGQVPLDPTKVSNFADAYTKGSAPSLTNMGRGIGQLGSEAGRSAIYNAMPTGTVPALGSTVASAMTPEQKVPEVKEDPSSGRYISKDFQAYVPPQPDPYYRPRGLGYGGYAEGGMVDPMQQMPNGGLSSIEGMRDGYAPAVNQFGEIPQFKGGGSLEMKQMRLGEGIAKDTDTDTAKLDAYDAAQKRLEKQFASANLKPRGVPKTNISKLGQIKTGIAAAAGGGSIGGYSDGGRMLKGPGDGMSDSIPATIGRKQPARLADGEFVVPADVVSHLGNGSTDAGAKRLYSMMDKVRRARTGKKKQAPAVKADKYMPA
jgi:hypothetical protein